MKLIVLNKIGETMIFKGLGPVEDNNVLGGEQAGVHQHCEGEISVSPISDSHQAIFCKKCGLRVLIPIGIKTYEDLRAHLSKLQQ